MKKNTHTHKMPNMKTTNSRIIAICAHLMCDTDRCVENCEGEGENITQNYTESLM